MRTICTFVLRLLVDTTEPEVLRGALQPMPEAVTLPFVGEEALLALLHDVIWQAAENVPREDGEEDSR